MIVDLLTFFKQTYTDVFGFPAPPLHDPCAVAYAIDPGLFAAKAMHVDIECGSELCVGSTVCDVWWAGHHSLIHSLTSLHCALPPALPH